MAFVGTLSRVSWQCVPVAVFPFRALDSRGIEHPSVAPALQVADSSCVEADLQRHVLPKASERTLTHTRIHTHGINPNTVCLLWARHFDASLSCATPPQIAQCLTGTLEAGLSYVHLSLGCRPWLPTAPRNVCR